MDEGKDYRQGRSREERAQNEKFNTVLLIIALVFLAAIVVLNYFIPGLV